MNTCASCDPSLNLCLLCWIKFVDNEQSLLVADAHLDEALPEAMKNVLNLAGRRRCDTLVKVDHRRQVMLCIVSKDSKELINRFGRFPIAEVAKAATQQALNKGSRNLVELAAASAGRAPEVEEKREDRGHKLVSMLGSLLGPGKTSTASTSLQQQQHQLSTSPPRPAGASGGGAMAGLLRKMPWMDHPTGTAQETAPLLLSNAESSNSSPVAHARRMTADGMPPVAASAAGPGAPAQLQPSRQGSVRVPPSSNALAAALLVAAGKRAPGTTRNVGQLLERGSVELFSYLESAKQQSLATAAGAAGQRPQPSNVKSENQRL